VKFIAKLVLTIILIPVFLIFLLSINLRFQLLVPSFWQKAFVSGDVYSKLSLSINKNLESQVIAQGGRAGDVKILTDLISSTNLEDMISKNVNNFLGYANGKASEIIVYIPVSKIPEPLLSQNFNAVKEQMSLPDLIKEFHVAGISANQIQTISHVGEWTWLLFIFATLLLALILFFLYLCVSAGKRLVAPAIALILSGLFGTAVYFLGTLIRKSWVGGLAGDSNTVNSLVGIMAPPIMEEILRIWLLFSAGAMILGIVLLFFKKPGYIRKPK